MGKLDEQEHKEARQDEVTETTVQTKSSEPEKVTPQADTKPGLFAKTKLFVGKVIESKKFRIAAPVVIIALVAVVALVEPVKFAALNLVTTGNAEVVVVDDTSLVPIEGARVTIGSLTEETDEEGRAVLRGLNFGTTTYTVEKANHTTISGPIKIQPGGNFVGPVKFHSEGTPVSITSVNKLSGEKISDFKAHIDGTEISVQSDEKGTAVLKVPSDRLGNVSIVVSAEGYNDLKQKVKVASSGTQPVTSQLTPAGKHYFLSNRSGNLGVYSANLDGTSQAEVIKGTDAEDDHAQLSISPDGKRAALVSKRDGQRGPDGRIVPALFAINLEKKTIKRIDEGVPIFSLLGWQDNELLIYTISYENYEKKDNNKIKRANINTYELETLHSQRNYADYYFYNEDRNHVYFNNHDEAVELYGFISLDLQSKSKNRVHKYPLGVTHTKPNILALERDNKWFEFDMRSQQIKDGEDPGKRNRVIVQSSSSNKIAWIETRDGRGVIVVADSDGNNAGQVTEDSNVSTIVRWVEDDYVIYHVAGSGESAHYIVHVASGTMTKISDVYAFSRYGYY
jgi:hypothetical protein